MIKYNNKKDQFHIVLKERVKMYLAKSDGRNVNKIVAVKTVLFTGAYVIFYCSYLSVSSIFLSIIFILFVAISHVLMAINLGHENLHHSSTNNKLIKKTLGLTFVLVGVNPNIWKLLHNFVHHHNTNIDKHDYDIETKGALILRFTESQNRNEITRFQHLYFPLLYSVLTLWWFIYKDTKYLINKRVYDYKIKTGASEIIEFLLFKALHLILYIVIPLMLKQDIFVVILSFFLLHFTQGIFLSMIFQPAHLVEKTKIFYLEKDNKIDHSWANHQLMTTCNFGNNSRFLNYILGGLNFQIEHHLFPRVSHIHYKNISQIVKRTTNEFNYPYNEYNSFLKALYSHYRYLKKLAIH